MTFKLSRQSRAVMEATIVNSTSIVQIIGQFAGTDMAFRKGDTYCRCDCMSKRIDYHPFAWTKIRVQMIQVTIWTVKSVTPCTMSCTLLDKYVVCGNPFMASTTTFKIQNPLKTTREFRIQTVTNPRNSKLYIDFKNLVDAETFVKRSNQEVENEDLIWFNNNTLSFCTQNRSRSIGTP